MGYRIGFEDTPRGEAEPIQYCGFGSCNDIPGHVGGHRCRCGKLVLVLNTNCEVHSQPPYPMTASRLMAYLEFASDGRDIANEPVIIGGDMIMGADIVNGQIVLKTFEDILNDMKDS